jgi:hypothetical protein
VERTESALAAWRREETGARGTAARADRLEENIMAVIRVTARPRREVSLGQWAFPGILLVLSVLLLPLASIYDWLGLGPGTSLLLPLATASGLCLVVFGLLLIGSHFKELSAILEEQRATKQGLWWRF